MTDPSSSSWTPPQPRALPALREHLAEQLRSPLQHQAVVAALAHGRGTVPPPTGDLARDAEFLIGEELARLAAATLFYVTEDMTRLATAAAQTLPVHSFHAQDLPAESGLVVFAEPIGEYVPDGQGPLHNLTRIVAVSWGGSNLLADPGIWVTFWSTTDEDSLVRFLRQHGLSTSAARDRIRSMHPELLWDNEITINYGAQNIGIRRGEDFQREKIQPAGRTRSGAARSNGCRSFERPGC